LVREFLAPGEKLIIPFAAFAIGASINFSVLLTSGMIGIVLGLMTVLLSGGGAMLFLYGWYALRKRPRPARNVLAGACESAVAGNAIATPAAIAMVDPRFAGIQDAATAQIATAVVVTAFLSPFVVAYVNRWQRRRGISPEQEEYYLQSRHPSGG
jgi:2-keto-3-deoxygluconate permease